MSELTRDSRPLMPSSWRYVPAPIPAWQRGALAVVGLGLIGLLLISARLSPNPAGMGTHQQLGLPPCTSVMWWNVRCPACGMTTSWAHLMDGHVVQSARANTGGMLLAMLAIILAPWMVVSGVRGRWWISPLDPQWLVAGMGVVFLVTTVQWVGRLLNLY